MLLANYDSDSGSDSDSGPSVPKPAPPPRAALVPTSSTTAKGAVKVKRKGPVKITLDQPKGADARDADEEAEADEGMPEMRKSKVVKGKGR